jgi:hypothetical protein
MGNIHKLAMAVVGTMLGLDISPLEDVVHVGHYLGAGHVLLAVCNN